jgi:GH43 family beta-xylosidase
MKRRDIRIRDPFILYENGTYYMYTSSGERTLSCYRSKDLDNWENGGVLFEIPQDFWAYKDVWAGEVHKYKGRYYLFVSLLGKNGLRGTQIAVSDKPDGRFVPLVDRAVTPLDKSCIDGTLYVCDGKPYILYSHDWPDNYFEETNEYIGEIWCSELTEDLTAMKGDAVRLFASNEVPISKATPDNTNWEGRKSKRYGSDAPFVQRLSDGALYLTWSPYLDDHYVVLGAVSESGSVFGPWEHLDKPLFEDDGGHAMFFNDADGRKIMCIHAPERHMLERAHLYHIVEDGSRLKILTELPL